jgi:hypothetical protein
LVDLFIWPPSRSVSRHDERIRSPRETVIMFSHSPSFPSQSLTN